MGGYSLIELADMHIINGRANGNGLRAAPLCQEILPQRRHPDDKAFASIDRRLGRTGTFKPFVVNWGKERSVQTADVEDCIMERAQENSGDITRQIAT
jgi:hypothetical protein